MYGIKEIKQHGWRIKRSKATRSIEIVSENLTEAYGVGAVSSAAAQRENQYHDGGGVSKKAAASVTSAAAMAMAAAGIIAASA